MSDLAHKVAWLAEAGGTPQEVEELIQQICRRYGTDDADICGLQLFCAGETRKTFMQLESLFHRSLPAYRLGQLYGRLSARMEQNNCRLALLQSPSKYAAFLVDRWVKDTSSHGRTLSISEKGEVATGFIEGILGHPLRPSQQQYFRQGLPSVN